MKFTRKDLKKLNMKKNKDKYCLHLSKITVPYQNQSRKARNSSHLEKKR